MRQTKSTLRENPEGLNGIDVARVRQAQDEMRRDPDGAVAKPIHQVAIEWQQGYRTGRPFGAVR